MTRTDTVREDAGRAAGHPVSLLENAGIAFIGCDIAGSGFILEPDEAQEWIDADPHNAEVLFPYLDSQDLDLRPDCSASRWIIDFNNRCLLDARFYPLPFERAKRLVYGERTKASNNTARQRWWQYADKQTAMRNAIAGLDAVVVTALETKQVTPMRVSTGQVFGDDLVVFAIDSYAGLAVLSSSAHQLWASTYASTRETRVRYSLTGVFETFPRPTESDDLAEIGRSFETLRSQTMLRRGLGRAGLDTLVNDPQIADGDIARIRAAQAELDHAMLHAYGWPDIPLGHGFHDYRHTRGWFVSPAAAAEILDRLLAENHRRALG